MFYEFMSSIKIYFNSLETYLSNEWRDLTPETYAILLILIALCGLMMMNNSTKKI